MFKKITLLSTLLVALNTVTLTADILDGTWHLRALDGMEVRKARAILEFNTDKMKLSGFDACNRISGALIKNADNNITAPLLMSTKMGCRGKTQKWVSNRLHTMLEEGFSVKEEERYGIKGITLKSPSHELFFKEMQRD